jgi:hypothetical protein
MKRILLCLAVCCLHGHVARRRFARKTQVSNTREPPSSLMAPKRRVLRLSRPQSSFPDWRVE